MLQKIYKIDSNKFLIVFFNILLTTNVTDKIMFSEGKLYKSTNMRTIVVGITHTYEL